MTRCHFLCMRIDHVVIYHVVTFCTCAVDSHNYYKNLQCGTAQSRHLEDLFQSNQQETCSLSLLWGKSPDLGVESADSECLNLSVWPAAASCCWQWRAKKRELSTWLADWPTVEAQLYKWQQWLLTQWSLLSVCLQTLFFIQKANKMNAQKNKMNAQKNKRVASIPRHLL